MALGRGGVVKADPITTPLSKFSLAVVWSERVAYIQGMEIVFSVVQEAVSGCFFDRPKPERIGLRLVRDEVLCGA